MRLRRPSDEAIARRLATGADDTFTYSEVGATGRWGDTAEALALRFDLDRRELPLGNGAACFERAREALFAWRHFDVPWVDLFGAGTPARTGQVVASLVRVAGLWFLNPCRVVYVEEDDLTAAFAYGTLPGHVERGEERFEVALDPESGAVAYRIEAFSRPALPAVRLAYPLARRLQARFAAATAQALARAVAR